MSHILSYLLTRTSLLGTVCLVTFRTAISCFSLLIENLYLQLADIWAVGNLVASQSLRPPSAELLVSDN